ncbi:unnamed protein product [Lampetra planeri]
MSKSAKRKNPLIVSSGDEDDGDVIPSTAPESATLVMRPKAELPAEQQGRDVGPVQLPDGEGWRNLTGRLAGLLSVAAELVVQLGSAAPAVDAAA